MPVPQPFPYQGSKRGQAELILSAVGDFSGRLIEPFAGSGAVSLAWLSTRRPATVWLNDADRYLMDLWRSIQGDPRTLCDAYRHHHDSQRDDPEEYFRNVRRSFNQDHKPADLLYLMNRCVKGAVRYNKDGEFNQSADHRRLGAQPAEVERRIFATSNLVSGRACLSSVDFSRVIDLATADDLVYMDPPYQGTSEGTDGRYRNGLSRNQLVEGLSQLTRRRIPFLLSYDGYGPNGSYGSALPEEFGRRIEIKVGRSAQATLLGREVQTVECLYVSHVLGTTIEERVSAKHFLQPSLL